MSGSIAACQNYTGSSAEPVPPKAGYRGLDYAYTLQGWLKGINSTGGTAKYDMGTDAYGSSINQFVAKDAIGLTLNYFANDYTGINGAPFPGSSALAVVTDRCIMVTSAA